MFEIVFKYLSKSENAIFAEIRLVFARLLWNEIGNTFPFAIPYHHAKFQRNYVFVNYLKANFDWSIIEMNANQIQHRTPQTVIVIMSYKKPIAYATIKTNRKTFQFYNILHMNMCVLCAVWCPLLYTVLFWSNILPIKRRRALRSLHNTASYIHSTSLVSPARALCDSSRIGSVQHEYWFL